MRELLDKRTVIIGRTGSGKTYLTKHLVPNLDGVVLILDYKRDYTDMPVGARIDAFLYRDVIIQALNIAMKYRIIVIDFSSPSLAIDEIQEITAVILEYILHVSGKFYIIVDEADIYAPKSGSSACLSQLQILASKGRSMNKHLITITQRVQMVHNMLITQAENLIVGNSIDYDLQFMRKYFGNFPDFDFSNYRLYLVNDNHPQGVLVRVGNDTPVRSSAKKIISSDENDIPGSDAGKMEKVDKDDTRRDTDSNTIDN